MKKLKLNTLNKVSGGVNHYECLAYIKKIID